MKRAQKRGFTIVELVIVIAVIAILAAVLIPTFSGVIEKANQSTDIQLIKNLNTALSVTLQERGTPNAKYATAYDAVVVCAENGYLVDTIVAKSSLDIAWSRDDGIFMLINTDNGEVVYPTGEEIKTNSATGNEVNYFIFRDSIPAEGNDAKYSIFASNGFKGNGDSISDVILNGVGFDVGYNKFISNINYTNTTGKAEDVLIRSNTFDTKLVVDAESDSVAHHGYVALVDVQAIKDASYDEFGIVGRILMKKGHAVAMNGSEIFCLMEAPEVAGEVKATTIQSGATIHKNMRNINAATGIEKDQSTGVANGHVEDCGAGRHSFSKLVVDSQHIYDICTCCGYSLITVLDAEGAIAKQSKNIFHEDNTVEEIVTPLLVYSTPADIEATIEEGKIMNLPTAEEPITDPVDPATFVAVVPEDEEPCEHNWEENISARPTCTEEGAAEFECTKCRINFHVAIPKAAHRFYDNKIGQLYSGEDTCSVCGKTRAFYYPDNYLVTIVEGVEYETLAEALAAAPTNGTEFKIKLLNDDAIKADDSVAKTQNGCWEIKAGQNVVIDLNGYSLKNLITADGTSQVFKNAGTLTILDSSDVDKNGTGTGRIFNDLYRGVIPGYWPTQNYATDIINNTGTLIIQSGLLYNTVNCGIGFVVDGYNGTMTMNGGYLKADYTAAVRIASYNNATPIFNLNDGTLEGSYAVYFDMANRTNVTFNMNGGSVLASGDNAFSLYWGNNKEYQCAYLNIKNGFIDGAVDGNLISYANTVISGGTFKSENEYQTTLCVSADGTLICYNLGYWYSGSLDEIDTTVFTLEKADPTKHTYYCYYTNSYFGGQYEDYILYMIARDNASWKGYKYNYSVPDAIFEKDIYEIYDLLGPLCMTYKIANGYEWVANGNGTYSVIPE